MENIKSEMETEETQKNESSEEAKSGNILATIVKWIFALLFIALVIGSLYWLYIQLDKIDKNNSNNTATINNQQNSIESSLTTGKNNKSDIEKLEAKITTLENNVKDLLQLNNNLQTNLSDSKKMNENFEKEFRELTTKQQEIIEANRKNIKTDEKYYIIEKCSVPKTTKKTITLPTAPSVTKNTITLPTIPTPVNNTTTPPTVPEPVKEVSVDN